MRKTYTLGLQVEKNILFVMDIFSLSFNSAVNEWARLTGHNDNLWNSKRHTYFNWKVVRTTEKALQRKDGKSQGFFGY